MEVALPKVKKKGGAEEVRSDEFRFGQLGQFHKKPFKEAKTSKRQASAGKQEATDDALSFLLKGI